MSLRICLYSFLTLKRLGPQELNYVTHRRLRIKPHLDQFLYSKRIPLVQSSTIAVAISGGGFRAMLIGAGFLTALDSRTPGNSHLGGILQSSTYIAGISGGLWILVNNLLNDDEPMVDNISKLASRLETPVLVGMGNVDVDKIRKKIDLKNLQQTDLPQSSFKSSIVPSILSAFFSANGSSKPQSYRPSFRQTLDFYRDLNSEVRAKRLTGYPTSLTDYWGRALARKVFPSSQKHTYATFSSIRQFASFQNFSQPFPIVSSVEKAPGVEEDSVYSHVYEFNPYEFGSWDSYLNLFADTMYLGTPLFNGTTLLRAATDNATICVMGYDNLGFITGTSSSIFNTLFEYVFNMILKMELESSMLLSRVLKMFGITNALKSRVRPEYAVYSPNPFYRMRNTETGRSVARNKKLYLADGGDDGQNIPLNPFLVRDRQVDIVFAVDIGSERDNFPNGTSLQRTAQRYHTATSTRETPVFLKDSTTRSIFPHVPSLDEYMENNYGRAPLFLGCDIKTDFPVLNVNLTNNMSSNDPSFQVWTNYTPPLIIYTANYNYSFLLNTSTFRTDYNPQEVYQMVKNGYNVATAGNDSNYSACVGCAILKRNLDKAQSTESLPIFCQSCLSKYCYKRTAGSP